MKGRAGAQTSPGSKEQHCSSDPQMQTRPLATLPGPGVPAWGDRGPRIGGKRAVPLSRQPLERPEEGASQPSTLQKRKQQALPGPQAGAWRAREPT